MPTLERDGNVFILNLGDGENRFNPEFVTSLNAAFDEVAGTEGPRALVVTASGKIWSNGLDLEWFVANQEQVPAFVGEVHEVFARAVELPVPTIAAIGGHCFAAGAMLALAFDERVMREDRGFFCMPEVDIRIPFTVGMDALIKARLTPQVAHEAMTTGRRYSGAEAAEAQIVGAAVAEDQVLPRAVERARELEAKDGATLGVIKQRLYAQVLEALRAPAESSLLNMGE